ncbi:aminoglycoside phosphotransferase [Microbacterium sp. P06]|uniref:maltokinase N-terminal cap-like domain-containing protein n=1 Tax=Microbacterium sp. P06 TaxID=3366949 RepID=UPI00374578B4
MDSTLQSLTDWMPAQRWYASKGRTPRLRLVAEWDVAGDDDARVRLLLVADEAPETPVLYQVPLVVRTGRPETGVIADLDDGSVLVDGATDPAYGEWLYQSVTGGGRISGTDGPLESRTAASRPATSATATSSVLGAEQSNTSLIFRPHGDGAAVICKLFRQVHPGLNPDIELQTALADNGSTSVPQAIGSLEGTWRDRADGDLIVTGSLAFAQEFLDDVEDAWRVALSAAQADDDFDARAEALGAAVADVHLTLSRILPTHEPTDSDRARVAAIWEGGLETAVGEIPELAPFAPAIRAVYADAAAAPWPLFQRVHGDLHLGQVLEVHGRGWVLLDFEGEPLRPIAARRMPDLAVRDVAGMLRSFDYVAGSVERLGSDDGAARRWATTAVAAFERGYAAAGGPAADERLLRAFELDKAVYEAVYEVRNRPDWLAIPLAAIERLTGR